MYEVYWGLKEKPFENTPDIKYIYYSSKHKEAIHRLLYAVREHKAAALLTGDYGSGKTLLSRILWQELQQEQIYKPVFILNPRLSTSELLEEIFFQLKGVKPSENKAELFRELYQLLYDNHKVKRHTIIVVDEAQAITSDEVFEELRLLLNFQLEDAFLFTLILLGQVELKSKIIKLPQLAQRISIKYHLSGLNEDEVKNYILHRLLVAGANKEIFEKDTYKLIYFLSGGIPRHINNICDLALLVGFGEEVKLIEKNIILRVADEIELGGGIIQKKEMVSSQENNKEDTEKIFGGA